MKKLNPQRSFGWPQHARRLSSIAETAARPLQGRAIEVLEIGGRGGQSLTTLLLLRGRGLAKRVPTSTQLTATPAHSSFLLCRLRVQPTISPVRNFASSVLPKLANHKVLVPEMAPAGDPG